MMELGREPDVIKNSLKPVQPTEDLDLDSYTMGSEAREGCSDTDDFGSNLIKLRVTQQIRELQTVIRDKCVLSHSHENDTDIRLLFNWF